MIILLAIAWALSVVLALTLGFYWSKRVPFHRTLRGEFLRRAGIYFVYAQAALAAVSPAYARRWQRKREEALQAYKENLVPIERAEWWDNIDRKAQDDKA